jgi:uncharacterized protein (TIGR01244 family)
MPMFRQLTDTILVSPQIDLDDLAEAVKLGVKHIINNRPEGESDDQTPGAVIEQAARDAGLTYVAIPVGHGGFSEGQVNAMAETLAGAQGPIWPIAARARVPRCSGRWPAPARAPPPRNWPPSPMPPVTTSPRCARWSIC